LKRVRNLSNVKGGNKIPKKYTIEAPLYSAPMESFAKTNRLDNIGVILFGGVPDSPLNGGRSNYMLDWLFLWDRFFLRLTKQQLSRLLSKFYDTITKANQNSIPVLITFSNIFISEEELTEENLYPLQFLVESSQKYGVKNGVIVNNKRLEEIIRQRHEDRLIYVGSCTKYVSSERLLSVRETQDLYQEDSGKYDYIVLTPQDSRRKRVIKNVLQNNKSKVVTLCNVFCSNGCNCYGHYEQFSLVNKKSLLTFRPTVDLVDMFKFLLSKVLQCPYYWKLFLVDEMKEMMKMQIKAGVTNFKIGRGFGRGALGLLVGFIQEHEKKEHEGGPLMNS